MSKMLTWDSSKASPLSDRKVEKVCIFYRKRFLLWVCVDRIEIKYMDGSEVVLRGL